MTHDEVLVAWLESGALDAEGEAHLATCEQCRALLAEIDVSRGSLGEAFAWEEPPLDLEDAVVAAVGAAVADAPDARPTSSTTAGDHDDRPAPAAGTRPQPTSTSGAAPVVDLDARRARSGGSRIATWVASAVAAVAVLVAVFAVSTRPAGDQTAAPDPFADAIEIHLDGTELAPGVKGTAQMVSTPSGVRIALDAPGLPRRDGGDYYQAWLRSPQGVLVPIGTFHDANDQVWLWSGVPVDQFPTFTVTQESADNDQASSGRRVLAGSLPGTAPATTATTR